MSKFLNFRNLSFIAFFLSSLSGPAFADITTKDSVGEKLVKPLMMACPGPIMGSDLSLAMIVAAGFLLRRRIRKTSI